jgi:hypothetical protein
VTKRARPCVAGDAEVATERQQYRQIRRDLRGSPSRLKSWIPRSILVQVPSGSTIFILTKTCSSHVHWVSPCPQAAGDEERAADGARLGGSPFRPSRRLEKQHTADRQSSHTIDIQLPSSSVVRSTI